MTDLGRLVDVAPSLGRVGPESPYVRLHGGGGETSFVDADVEWNAIDGRSSRVAVAVTEHDGDHREAVIAAIFDHETGKLLVAGSTVSTAGQIIDSDHREAVLQAIVGLLVGLQVLGEETSAP